MSSRNKPKSPNSPEEIRQHALENGHRLRTRRDFLSHGLIFGVGTVLAPGVVSLLSNSARADELASCTASGEGVRRVAFINIDLAGGPNLIGQNIIVGGRGGQLDVSGLSYNKMGANVPSSKSIVHDFGLAFHPESFILKGLCETTSTDIRGKIDGVILAAETTDDSQTNQQNPAHWIVKSGTRGKLLPQVGNRSGVKAGTQAFPSASMDSRFAPAQVRTVEDVRSLALATKLHEALGEERTSRVLAAIRTMSTSRLEQFNELDLPSQVKTLVDCGYLRANESFSQLRANELDPSTDPIFLGKGGAFELNLEGVGNNTHRVHAACVSKLVLSGVAGAGTIELGGRDYHGYDRDFTNTRDRELGQIIGRIVTAASKMGRDVMLNIMTDGAVVTSEPGKAWETDSSLFSAGIMLVYKHKKTDSENGILRNKGQRQVGSYTSDGIDYKNFTLITDSKGTNSNLARCVVANYLALHGEEGRLAQVIGPSDFDGKLDGYLMFQKIT